MGGCNKSIVVDVFYHGSLSVKIFISIFHWEVIQEVKCVKVPGKNSGSKWKDIISQSCFLG